MNEIFKPYDIYCGYIKTAVSINVKGRELVDGANGYVSQPCKDCPQWTLEKIREVLEDAEQSYSTQLVQALVDQSRFKGGEKKIVISRCSPLGTL